MPTPRRSRQSQREDELGRYREAADFAIENLDWCINYLHRIRRHKIAHALRENRMAIVKRYRRD